MAAPAMAANLNVRNNFFITYTLCVEVHEGFEPLLENNVTKKYPHDSRGSITAYSAGARHKIWISANRYN